ncbi:helix-turn-helix transcriptional regulator [Amycolatopsis keratiniphila subsp. nogabecina]|uniref:Helix-turn-helix transcriptional regulator n=1 Tax=Amycolatopsis keratiniphila subsp. keratiniphila TaxID=227715 RepID=A0A1W2LYT7_9PSEU|nr:helix-turn-helix transcriptional regulator [Amycolatopsis keratiniphila subsp. nogabecina]ONF72368.1 helix-turn-helix transcriptional regulator [Amycolatopsis keratiniphila subsp. keratiniphila]SDU70788.1 regulatory protein, luxR family [Amycolatopsis keratiniphila]
MSTSPVMGFPASSLHDLARQRATVVTEDEAVRKLARSLVRRVMELNDGGSVQRKPLLDVTEHGVRCLLVPVAPEPHDLLSPREHEVARMVGRGYTNKQIAGVLEISLNTVSAHMRRIFTKLGVGSRAAMVAALTGENLAAG